MRKAGPVLGVLLFAAAVAAGGALHAQGPNPDLRQPPENPPVPAVRPVIPRPELDLGGPDRSLQLSVFLGRAGGDIFSSLHEKYAWRLTFKSMTVGLGVYREIPLARGVELLPYLGVIRSSATLRPSDLFVQGGVYEYRLTVFCAGLPLVIRFD